LKLYKNFFARFFLCENLQDTLSAFFKSLKEVLYAALACAMSGNSRQVVLHGCLPAETAAIHFAAWQHTGNKPVAQRYFPASPQPVLFPEQLNYRGVFALQAARLKGANPWLA
jgi:hypothetical protein